MTIGMIINHLNCRFENIGAPGEIMLRMRRGLGRTAMLNLVLSACCVWLAVSSEANVDEYGCALDEQPAHGVDAFVYLESSLNAFLQLTHRHCTTTLSTTLPPTAATAALWRTRDVTIASAQRKRPKPKQVN